MKLKFESIVHQKSKNEVFFNSFLYTSSKTTVP